MELVKTLFLAGNYWPLIVKNSLILTGYAVLLLWLATRTPAGVPASLGVTAWAVALSVAAVAATAALTWLPQRAPPLGAASLAAGLLAYVSGL